MQHFAWPLMAAAALQPERLPGQSHVCTVDLGVPVWEGHVIFQLRNMSGWWFQTCFISIINEIIRPID